MSESQAKRIRVQKGLPMAALDTWATADVDAFAAAYPQVREIDLLNAYLKAFTKRVSEEVADE